MTTRRCLPLLVAALAACAPAPPPANDASSDAADFDAVDAAAVDAPAVDAPPRDTGRDRTPLRYTPAGCGYEVRTTTGTINNRMGDDATFGPEPAPRGVHVSWPADPSRGAAVVWSTDDATLATVVEYGTAPDALTQVARGHRSVAGTGLIETPVATHEVHLCGLQPDTTYYYRAGGSGHWSAVQRFRTAPLPGGSAYDVNFVVMGDSRDHPEIWQQINEQVAALSGARQPDFVVFSGDAVALGATQSQWDAWFAAASRTQASMPFLMAHGNHEILATNYLAQFAQPQAPTDEQSELFFSLDYGPIHFVVLNDSPLRGNLAFLAGAEREWLERDLAAVDRRRTPWVIAVHHKPPFTSSRHRGDADIAAVRAAWPPVYDRYDVDLVINGHEHNIEVTHPLRGDGALAPAGEHGTVYLVTGGAGAPLYGAGRNAFTRFSESVRHFVVVHATERALEATPRRADGTVITDAVIRLARP